MIAKSLGTSVHYIVTMETRTKLSGGLMSVSRPDTRMSALFPKWTTPYDAPLSGSDPYMDLLLHLSLTVSSPTMKRTRTHVKSYSANMKHPSHPQPTAYTLSLQTITEHKTIQTPTISVPKKFFA